MRRSELPVTALPAWMKLNDVNFYDVRVQQTSSKGLGLFTTRSLSSEDTFDPPTLIHIPKDLVLSKEAVEEHGKVDKLFQELLDCAGGQSARGDVMLFLLMQITLTSPDVKAQTGAPSLPNDYGSGVSNPWTEYVRMLPSTVPVPTCWSEEQMELLIGTSLESALRAKLAALLREFEYLKTATHSIAWCTKSWFENATLEFDDWILLDAWYRSRCLEIPNVGEAMIPCLDFANHNGSANAYYEKKGLGGISDIQLLLRPGNKLDEGAEVSISYGSGKSSAEMLFSYGFIESGSTTSSVVLDVRPMQEDPLGKAKLVAFNGPRNVCFEESTDGGLVWKSPFLDLLCLNEEDGLDFRMLQEVDGTQSQLRTFWQGKDVSDSTEKFAEHFSQHPLRDIFKLRVVAILQDRVGEQIERLHASRELLEQFEGDQNVLATATSLRDSETVFLESAYLSLDVQKMELAKSPTVLQYLESSRRVEDDSEIEVANDEDFS